MAKTIRTKVFNFSELNEKAKQQAINWYRNLGIDSDYIYDEAHKTVQEFDDIFNTGGNRQSWFDCNFSKIDESVLNLKGLRLQKYIWNNYADELYKGKYYSVKSGKPMKHKRVKSEVLSNGNIFNSYRSAVTKVHDCPLTGMCYDEDILQPIYNILENYNKDQHENLTFEELLQDCKDSLKKAIESEEDYLSTDEHISEQLEINGYYFTKDGVRFS